MSGKFEWKYRKASDTHDLYFSPYGDDPELVASVCCDTEGDWIFSSRLLDVEHEYFISCNNIDDAKVQMIALIDQYYADQVKYYSELLEMVREELYDQQDTQITRGKANAKTD